MPVLEDAAQAAGSTAADGRRAARSARSRRSRFFPSQEPRRVRRRRRGRDHDDALAERVRMLRFHGSRDKVRRSSWSATTRASTSCRPRSCGSAPAPRRLGATAAARAAAHYEEAGLGELVDAAGAVAGLAAGVAPLRRAPSASADELAAALRGAGIGQQGLLPRADAPPAGDARVRGGRRAARHRRGRAHAPRDPDEPGAAAASRRPRWSRPARAVARIECAECAAGSAPRPCPSTVTPSRRSRWTPGWSRWPTSSPIGCASTGPAACPTLYHDLFVRTLGFVVIGNVAIFTLFGLYRHWMRYSSQARVPADRAGRASASCSRSSPTSRSCSRSCCSRRRAASSRSTRRPACSRSTGC